ncbi:MAG: MFS transporter, partial [Anaerolineales bacterium]|nr:MFS transporter [Anaerolineales bacterium]
LALTWIAVTPSVDHLGALYAAVFVAGLARGFADPAASAFEAQVVPRELYVNASTWSGSVWQATSILGPALGGVIYAGWGAAAAYGWVAGLLALSGLSMALIRPKPLPVVSHTESIWSSIAAGVRYVWHHQVLLGSMALDLFAVLFGGAVALLPIFASDILRVGPSGLGLLAAAPAVGALASMLWTARRPPVRHAGRLLLTAVAGFGLAMLVFAWSRVFWLSLAALAVSGLCDGLSVVIRETILRLHSPDALRGRIAAVSWIFIGSSNEIGAFESGLAAGWLGPVPAVWLGGLVTLLVVAVTAVAAPELRALHLDPAAPAPAAGPAAEPG